jgi:hypothetical protein
MNGIISYKIIRFGRIRRYYIGPKVGKLRRFGRIRRYYIGPKVANLKYN